MAKHIGDGVYEYVSDDGVPYQYFERPSRIIPPFNNRFKRMAEREVEVYESDVYIVTCRRFDNGFFVKNSKYVLLGIMHRSNAARHDWREFQQIKNKLVGPDWEAVELYPAETRLIDPSNEYFLWCVPKGILKFGLGGSRKVLAPEDALAPQRPFPATAKAIK